MYVVIRTCSVKLTLTEIHKYKIFISQAKVIVADLYTQNIGDIKLQMNP